MSKLKLTVACGDYEIIRALKEGTVTADGLDLVFLTGMGSREFSSRMARRQEFDVCEAGIRNVVQVHDKHPDMFAMVPVFLHRRFRHGFVFVNTASGISSPKDLIGKRVGGNFAPTSNVWVRGILQDHHDVPYTGVSWVAEARERSQITPPAAFKVELVGESLEELLAEGKLAALVTPAIPQKILDHDKRVGYLFGDYKEAEYAYYRKTGIFPIMHGLAVRREIVDKYPWVTTNLLKAFDEAKAVAYRRLINPRVVPLVWYRSHWEEQERIFGEDPYAYGLGPANRKNLETMIRYMHEQGLIDRVMPLAELFAACDPVDYHDMADEGPY